MIFLSNINQNGTLFGFLQFFLHTQPLTLFGCNLQSWKVQAKLSSQDSRLFHPGTILNLLNCCPFSQKYFLDQLFRIIAKRKRFMLRVDSLLENLPELFYVLHPQTIEQRIDFWVFLEKWHVSYQHQNQDFATAENQIFDQILAVFFLWNLWPPTYLYMSLRI